MQQATPLLHMLVRWHPWKRFSCGARRPGGRLLDHFSRRSQMSTHCTSAQARWAGGRSRRGDAVGNWHRTGCSARIGLNVAHKL